MERGWDGGWGALPFYVFLCVSLYKCGETDAHAVFSPNNQTFGEHQGFNRGNWQRQTNKRTRNFHYMPWCSCYNGKDYNLSSFGRVSFSPRPIPLTNRSTPWSSTQRRRFASASSWRGSWAWTSSCCLWGPRGRGRAPSPTTTCWTSHVTSTSSATSTSLRRPQPIRRRTSSFPSWTGSI